MKNIKLSTNTKGDLRKLGVEAVYLFGSQAEETTTKLSDFDVAVLFNSASKIFGNISEAYDQLYDIFSEIFDLSGFKNIDIVFLQNVPLQLRYKIVTSGKILFQDNYEFVANYKEKTILEYADFSPLRNLFNQAVLAKI